MKVQVYRVKYRVSELEKSRTLNSRSYTLMAKSSERTNIIVQSHVPVTLGASNYQNQNVGMNLYCTISEHESKLLVHTRLSWNTIAEDERAPSNGRPPVTHDLQLEDDTPVVLGKPALVGSIDDVYSNRRYEIEVTVTKLR